MPTSLEKPHKLFVYGTLLTEEGNWEWCLSPQEGTKAELAGADLYNLGSFPGMKLTKNPFVSVVGELFEITDDQLAKIDRLEGYLGPDYTHNLYNRVTVTLSDGQEAYTYVYNGDIEESWRIPSGNWRKR